MIVSSLILITIENDSEREKEKENIFRVDVWRKKNRLENEGDILTWLYTVFLFFSWWWRNSIEDDLVFLLIMRKNTCRRDEILTWMFLPNLAYSIDLTSLSLFCSSTHSYCTYPFFLLTHAFLTNDIPVINHVSQKNTSNIRAIPFLIDGRRE